MINVDRMFFAVAANKTVRKMGVQKFENVKADIEAMLMAEKKAEMVAEMVNKDLASSSMEAVAQKYSTQLMDSVMLYFAGDMYQNRGVEAKAIGKIFTLPANKPTAVAGRNMVYVANVQQTTTGAATPGYMLEKNMLRNVMMGRERGEATLMTYLIQNTPIIDNRYKFYQK